MKNLIINNIQYLPLHIIQNLHEKLHMLFHSQHFFSNKHDHLTKIPMIFHMLSLSFAEKHRRLYPYKENFDQLFSDALSSS